MSDVVVDSSILIDYLRGQEEAAKYLQSLRQENRLATHAVVVAEILTGARNRQEQNQIAELVRLFRIRQIDSEASELSIELLKTHRLASGVGWLDCLIAATCLRNELDIATLNEKHFTVFAGLRITRPY